MWGGGGVGAIAGSPCESGGSGRGARVRGERPVHRLARRVPDVRGGGAEDGSGFQGDGETLFCLKNPMNMKTKYLIRWSAVLCVSVKIAEAQTNTTPFGSPPASASG